MRKLRALKLGRAAEIVAAGVDETLSYYSFPSEHWRSLRTNNPLERGRRVRVVAANQLGADTRKVESETNYLIGYRLIFFHEGNIIGTGWSSA